MTHCPPPRSHRSTRARQSISQYVPSFFLPTTTTRQKQGINPKINKKTILKECKKKFNCNGCLVQDPDLGEIIQLQGDQRKVVAQFLIDEKIAKKDVIKIHGS